MEINVLIPMAGEGSRFRRAGYEPPKPLIDVNGKPMIQRVVENINLPKANHIFLVRREHFEDANTFFSDFVDNFQVVYVDELTEGAACTVLLAKELINNDSPLLIANSDQLVDNISMSIAIENNSRDGFILAFRDNNPKWSFAKVNELGLVTEVAEKNPISEWATVGIYFFKKGSLFVESAEQMIDKNIRTNNEFYVCPVFNELIGNGFEVAIKVINKDQMHGLGTPEDLERYLG